MKKLLNKEETFDYYEKELPEWLNHYLFHNHQHLVANDYGEPEEKWETIIPEDGGEPFKSRTDKYIEWFDENQQLFYDEETVINIIKALTEGYEIIKLKNGEFRIKK